MMSNRAPVILASMLLIATTASAGTLSFQQGDGGAYSSTDGVSIDMTTRNWGSEVSIGAQSTFIQSLLRFPDIIGGNIGQIPPGATITYASLTLTMVDVPIPMVLVDMHEVYVTWDENTVTGNSFYAQPGTLYGPKIGTMPVGDPFAQVLADVTSLVQSWVNGPNFGLMLRLAGDGLAIYYSDDVAMQAYRPKLTVEFTTPPVATESTTWGRVKALYR